MLKIRSVRLNVQAKLQGKYFICHSRMMVDFQVLEVDAGYKIRYDKFLDTDHM